VRSTNSLPRIGIDIVFLPRFKKVLEKQDERFVSRVFHPTELKKESSESLAAIFAAKEAVIKALGLPAESWLSIEVSHNQSGEPLVRLIKTRSFPRTQLRLSISHEKDYVVAVVLAG
jgi:holo-[acyl-carrier protein] synthase